ncbi:MAG: glyoxalase/bleomycin resistance/extradiol dioxygenase family protein [Alphaproteobacteria bacterium]|nr:glyoxalase/bleomycin resistance/extradiol dioxygenase family protein [Alphaproteobacteria bacterium]
MKLNPYLTFGGNCEAAFKFYEKVLGGKIQAMMTAEGTPMEQHAAPEWRNKIMHARMTVGDTVLMGSDAPPGQRQPMAGFSVTLNVDEPAEADRLFQELSQNAASVAMPIQETFWARRFGMLVDQFGTPWMINCEKPMS